MVTGLIMGVARGANAKALGECARRRARGGGGHKVIKTKSVEYMPFFLSLVSFLNGVCCTSYALIKFDLYITVSNISNFR